ncbi:replication associated protein [Gigaspora margarita]|uniref:Replication associated protein n=2 Tax=root TaxID=1 RepID=A0A8H4A8R9_GIGMA|nr:replication associated protein [Gigaspora margarita]QED42918.1 putative RdRp [Gigaspora circovirus A]
MSDFSDTEANFRLDSAQLHLTYIKCDLDLEDILNHVKFQCESKKKNVMNYIVVRKPYPDETPHIHAYFRLCSKLSIRDPHFFDIEIFDYDKKYRSNVEGVRTSKKVKEYITKDEDYISDTNIDTLNKAIYMVNSGATICEIAMKCPKTYVKSGRGLENLKARVDENNFKFKGKPFIEVHYGDKNCGKSTYTELYPDDIAYRFDDEGYFDGYDGQEILIFDEFNGRQLKLSVFLKIASGQQRRFNVKGKKVMNNVRHIIITSNNHYTEWYKQNKYEKGQSEWRLDCIWHYIKNEHSFSQRKLVRNPYTFTEKEWILNYLKKIDYSKKFPESLSHDEKVFEGYIGIPYNPKFNEDPFDGNEFSEDIVQNDSTLQTNFDNSSENNKRKKRDDFNNFERVKRKKVL